MDKQTNHERAAKAHDAAATAYETQIALETADDRAGAEANTEAIDAATERVNTEAGIARCQDEAADRATAAAQWVDGVGIDDPEVNPDAALAAATTHRAAAAAHRAAVSAINRALVEEADPGSVYGK